MYSINTAMEDADKVLEYYVPEDGSNIWYDAWTMPKGAKNKELAYEFLNYLSDPINAADNMDYIGYSLLPQVGMVLLIMMLIHITVKKLKLFMIMYYMNV